MDLQVGDTGTLTYSDGTSSKVIVVEEPISLLGTTWFSYDESEKNRPITYDLFPDKFPLPYFIVKEAFTKDL